MLRILDIIQTVKIKFKLIATVCQLYTLSSVLLFLLTIERLSFNVTLNVITCLVVLFEEDRSPLNV
jgi:hypothetical protein